jgi:UDP-N-acetylglucosamine 1-carboxyvinyltransferase
VDKIRIVGGVPLIGEIAISGAKNAALPILAATLLCPEEVEISNVPDLHDIVSMAALLKEHGVDIKFEGEFDQTNGSKNRKAIVNASGVNNYTAHYDLVRKMRASIWVLGPLLARFGQAKVSLPGGCAIGTRPVDLHLMALEKMGAEIKIEGGYILAQAPNGLKGAEIHFKTVSVGATGNAMMAATLAQGTTIITNAALEPEMCDLAKFLNAMGAKVSGAGTSTITIEGVEKLHSTKHILVPDRIEAGTFAVAAAITGGDIKLTNVDSSILDSVLDNIQACGSVVTKGDGFIRVENRNKKFIPISITTAPYPNFPTDMQAQMMSLLTLANGTSHITETIFENRFMHVPELARMGAQIAVNDNTAIINGVGELTGAPVMATDLRASVSLVLAALAANGESIVNRVYHLDRGYEHIEQKLRACGANIERIA